MSLKTIKERYDDFLKELKLTEKARLMDINETVNLMLDESVEWTNVAEAYILRMLRIPSSYYHGAVPSHKKEILVHARSLMPKINFNVLFEGKSKILATGPVEAAKQFEMLSVLQTKDSNVFSIYGSLFSGSVTLYLTKGMVGDFGSGIALTLTPLFGRGMSVYPAMFELRCTNGAVDIRAIGTKLKSEEKGCILDSIEAAMSISWELSEKRQNVYDKMVEKYKKQNAMMPLEVQSFLEKEHYPKSYIEKTVAITEDVKVGKTNPELPSSLATMMDNWSIATYSARNFSSATRNRLEERLMGDMLRG